MTKDKDEVMLAVTYDPDKVQFPVEVSVKLDGCAADFYSTPLGWIVQSRQGKPIPSAAGILEVLNKCIQPPSCSMHIVGELTVMGVPAFKDAGGIIRRGERDDRIILNIYDVWYPDAQGLDYEARIGRIGEVLKKVSGKNYRKEGSLRWSTIRRVPVLGLCADVEGVAEYIQSISAQCESSGGLVEGIMIRQLNGKDSHYNVGKRSKNMMRFKPKPTMDLLVESFEEAISKDGEPKGMVGRINCLYAKGVSSDGMNEFTDYITIGVGPGCLTHPERKELWKRYQALLAKGESLRNKKLIAEVEYMKDDSYDALRQPVFKRWRTDKKEASQHE